MRKTGWRWIVRQRARVLVVGAGACALAVVLLLAGDGVAARRTQEADGSFRQTVYSYAGWEKQEGDLQGVRTAESRSYIEAEQTLRRRIRAIPAGSPQSSREREQRTLENVTAVYSAGRTARAVFAGCFAVALACLLTWRRSLWLRGLALVAAGIAGLFVLYWYVGQIEDHTEAGLFIVRPKSRLHMTSNAAWASGLLVLVVVAAGLTSLASLRADQAAEPAGRSVPPDDNAGGPSASWTPAAFAAACTSFLALPLLFGLDRLSFEQAAMLLLEVRIDGVVLAAASLLWLRAFFPIRFSVRRRLVWAALFYAAALGSAWLAPGPTDGRVLLLLFVGVSLVGYELLRRKTSLYRAHLALWIVTLTGYFTPFFVLEDGEWVERPDGTCSPSQATYVHRRNFFGLNTTGSLWIGESDVVRIRWFTFELNP